VTQHASKKSLTDIVGIESSYQLISQAQ